MSKHERTMWQMKKATVSDLRHNFSKIERMLRAGQEVEITKRGRVIAHLLPDTGHHRPDFLARLKTIYGNKKLRVTGAELISQERDDR